MSRKLVPVLLALGAAQALAQSAAYVPPNLKAEIFGGYSLVNPRPGRDLDRLTLNGWTASFTSYQQFARWGLTAEFEGSQHDKAEQQAFLFGGTFRARQWKRLALTGRILAGVTRWEPKLVTRGVDPEQNAFTFGFGQAIDVKFTEQLALRVQPGFRFVRLKDPGGDSRLTLLRPFSIGLAYKFGKR